MAASDLIVFGSLNMDIVVGCDAMPQPGETVFGTDVHYLPGGKGFNQAVAAAKWDITPRMIGAVGGDEFGAQLLEYAGKNNVQTDHVQRHAGRATGTAHITVSKTGENSIIVVSGANAKAKIPDKLKLTGETIALAQFETPLGETETLFTQVKKKGGQTILNPSPFQVIPKTLLAQCDFIIVNQVELAQMTAGRQSRDPEAAEWALRILNPSGCYIVTLGSQGCLCSYKGDVEYFPGYQVDTIDTTGAGDCFAGTFAACIAKGFGYSHAAMLANAAAALSTTKRGAAPSMPGMADVHALIDPPQDDEEAR